MVYEYVLIDSSEVDERDLKRKLENHPNVHYVQSTIAEETLRADPFFNTYNLIARVESDSYEEIHNIIKNDIFPLPSVHNTMVYTKPKTIYNKPEEIK